jgi:HSP20 family protein
MVGKGVLRGGEVRIKRLSRQYDIDAFSANIDRLFQSLVASTGRRWMSVQHVYPWHPPTDVYETDEYLVVKVEIAGMDEEQLNLFLADRTLVIRGVREDPTAKLAYQQFEIAYGPFQTEIYLSHAVEEDKVEALYKDGFLKVILPKVKAKRVKATFP